MSDFAEKIDPDDQEDDRSTVSEEDSEGSNVQSDQNEDQEGQEPKQIDERVRKPVNKNERIVILGDFEIDTQARVPSLDNGEVKAYKAKTRKGREGFFAYVSEPHLVPRHNKIEIYKTFINLHIPKLLKTEAIYWPPAEQERFIFIYYGEMGKKIIEPNKEQVFGLRNEVVYDKILKPLVSILQDFRDKDFVHGAIRASNIYDGGSNNYSKIMLGDCLSAPSSYTQNSLYEPIDRAMAAPIARGPGTLQSDLYSLGVTLAVLLRQTDPMAGLSPEAIIKKKVEQGSYVAITGKDRFTGPILELLRGLLIDDAAQRWTIEDVGQWMDGRRLSPKQSSRKLVAPRPIHFSGKKYLSPMLLAMDIGNNPIELKKIIDDGDLKNWINRALEKPRLYERVEDAITVTKNSAQSANFEERLASNVSMALDGEAPIRYLQAHMHPDGIGSMLAEAFALKKDLNFFADIFTNSAAINWLKYQTNQNVDIGNLVQKYDSCRMYVRQKTLGFGLERCLYLLNPEVRCMSEKLKNYYVRSPEDMMFAFEDICQNGKSPPLFIDRHIAAFLSIKDSKLIDSLLPDLNMEEHYKKIMANLACFAIIQRRSQLPYFPAIAKVFSDNLHVVYKRFHDRTIREKLQKTIEKFAQDGDLIKMHALLENPELQQKDFIAFKKAMKEFEDLKKESTRLELKLVDKNTFGLATGQEASALISSIIAALIILFVGYLFFTGSSVF
ncbi:MAG: hypothetical protein ACK4VI_05990 [Alphaproteobacteria bacterium]